MALNKEIKFKNGLTVKYHKINNIAFDNNILKVTVSSYFDKNYREPKKKKIL